MRTRKRKARNIRVYQISFILVPVLNMYVDVELELIDLGTEEIRNFLDLEFDDGKFVYMKNKIVE